MRISAALLVLSCGFTLPAHAQQRAGDCFLTNYDAARGVFTVVNPQPGAVNQQCFITVAPKSAFDDEIPPRALREGSYVITLSGGGAGGAGGSASGGGAGGGSAMPEQVKTSLMPGVYRVTLGTGGAGGAGCGAPNASMPQGGSPSSVSDAFTGQTIAGVPRAEYWAGSAPVRSAEGASDEPATLSSIEGGGVRAPGTGGRGGSSYDGSGRDGVPLPALSGPAGRGGSGDRVHLAGGGGGAGFGAGGDGASPAANRLALPGTLGGGGGGGHGGRDCSAGAPGGHGFVHIQPS